MESLKVFVVYDSKVGAFLNPFVLRARGEAIRAWTTAVNDPNTDFAKYPSDFTLFEIGDYSQEKGSFRMYDAKISLGTALEFKNLPPADAGVRSLRADVPEVKSE